MRPATATPSSATARAWPPTRTPKSPGAGTEVMSSTPSKTRASALACTDMLSSAGPVRLLTACPEKLAAALPARSRSLSPPATLEYPTVTPLCPYVTGAARASVSAVPSIATPVTLCLSPPPVTTENAAPRGFTVRSSASSKTRVRASAYTDALKTEGGVASPVTFETSRRTSPGAALPARSRMGPLAGAV